MPKYFCFKEVEPEGKLGYNTHYQFDDTGINVMWKGESRHTNVSGPVMIITGDGFPRVIPLCAPKRKQDLLSWFCGFGPAVRVYNLSQFNELVRIQREKECQVDITYGTGWQFARKQKDDGTGGYQNVAIYVSSTVDDAGAEELLRTFKSASFPDTYIMGECGRVGLNVDLAS